MNAGTVMYNSDMEVLYYTVKVYRYFTINLGCGCTFLYSWGMEVLYRGVVEVLACAVGCGAFNSMSGGQLYFRD